MDDLRNKRVTVAGLGHFGGNIAAARWLVARGAKVLVTDKAEAGKLADGLKQLKGLPVEYRLGGHEVGDFTNADLVVVSPAIKPTNEFVVAARQGGVPVTTEIRLFLERCRAKVVGVTGTKGKSTTTALLGRMLEGSGFGVQGSARKVWVGGNIGKSLLGDLERIGPDDLVVLELSSFMLEYLREAKWSPHVAVVTMLAVDHVDWHGSAEAYIEAKKGIVKFQTEKDWAVLGAEVERAKEFALETRGKVLWFNASGRRFDLRVPGEHNQFNAQAAFAAASILGVTWEEAQRAVADFGGLPHRLELVHERNGVRYFNDSIATIPEAAVAALRAFEPRTVVQIVGGASKGSDFGAMCQALNERAKAVLCIGQTGVEIEALLRTNAGPRGRAVHNCETLEAAMARAKEIARQGDVVLLSTGCASYGQFVNFEERGQRFAKLARED
jgi:UDP-N-acetylmuramoylalanine--D-glutamate ligase